MIENIMPLLSLNLRPCKPWSQNGSGGYRYFFRASDSSLTQSHKECNHTNKCNRTTPSRKVDDKKSHAFLFPPFGSTKQIPIPTTATIEGIRTVCIWRDISTFQARSQPTARLNTSSELSINSSIETCHAERQKSVQMWVQADRWY